MTPFINPFVRLSLAWIAGAKLVEGTTVSVLSHRSRVCLVHLAQEPHQVRTEEEGGGGEGE